MNLRVLVFSLFWALCLSGVVADGLSKKELKRFYKGAMLNVHAKNTKKTPLFSAHRGNQTLGPENSFPSFHAAGRLGVWAIETDFRMTKDQQVICMHDETINRTTTGKGKVAQYTLAELRKFKLRKVNSSGNYPITYNYESFSDDSLRIPTMDDYFDICVRYRCVPFIELKEDNGVIAQMMESIRRHGLEGSCIISSTKLELLQAVRAAGCKELVHLIFCKPSQLDAVLELGNSALAWNIPNPHANITDKFVCHGKNPSSAHDLIKMSHQLNLRVCLRAIDTPEAAQEAFRLKTDYMPTNCMYPALLK